MLDNEVADDDEDNKRRDGCRQSNGRALDALSSDTDCVSTAYAIAVSRRDFALKMRKKYENVSAAYRERGNLIPAEASAIHRQVPSRTLSWEVGGAIALDDFHTNGGLGNLVAIDTVHGGNERMGEISREQGAIIANA